MLFLMYLKYILFHSNNSRILHDELTEYNNIGALMCLNFTFNLQQEDPHFNFTAIGPAVFIPILVIFFSGFSYTI